MENNPICDWQVPHLTAGPTLRTPKLCCFTPEPSPSAVISPVLISTAQSDVCSPRLGLYGARWAWGALSCPRAGWGCCIGLWVVMCGSVLAMGGPAALQGPVTPRRVILRVMFSGGYVWGSFFRCGALKARCVTVWLSMFPNQSITFTTKMRRFPPRCAHRGHSDTAAPPTQPQLTARTTMSATPPSPHFPSEAQDRPPPPRFPQPRPPRSCGLPGALPAPQPRTPEGKAAPRGPPPLSSGLNTGGRRSPALPAQLGVSSKSPAAHQPRGGGSEAWREPPHTQNGGRALTPPARPP